MIFSGGVSVSFFRKVNSPARRRGNEHEIGRDGGWPRSCCLPRAVPGVGRGSGRSLSGFQTKSNDPVQVDAQTLEVYEEGKERIAVFTGDVAVKRGDTTLRPPRSSSTRTPRQTDAFSRIEADARDFRRNPRTRR